MVDTLALRASSRWREKEEISAGYLKRTIFDYIDHGYNTVQQKAHRKNIPCLRHPVTEVLCHSKDDMLQAASSFYTSLYSPDPIDPDTVEQLFSSLPSDFCISAAAKFSLVLVVFVVFTVINTSYIV
ncbi:unnamed protein product [Rhizopus stolonifer]